jgi:hypothetical protein
VRVRSVWSVLAVMALAGALVAGCGSGSDNPSASDISTMSCHQLAGVHFKLPSGQNLTSLVSGATNIQSEMDSANAFIQRLVALGGCPGEPSLGGRAGLQGLVPPTNQP